MAGPVLTEQIDARGVATLTLNRPERRNALDAELIAALDAAASRLGEDRDVRVVVLTGAGDSFCAGGDLDWMRAQFDAGRADRIAEALKLAHMLRALNTMPKPLIGRVQGQAYGGGVGLMAVCDVAVAVAHAQFGLTETRLGLIPATIGPYVLARIGEGAARRVMLSGRRFDAAEAQALGLARVVAPDALDAAVEAEVAPCLSAAPGAMARAKRLARALGPVIDDATMAASAQVLADAWENPEAREGVSAFFNRRTPWWAAR